MSWGSHCGLKYSKKRARYENSTHNVTFDPATCQAHSYKWWCFVRKIKGKVVFNDYRYSSSTSGHQSAVRSLLRELNIKIDVIVSTSESLTDSLDSVVAEKYREIARLNCEIARKGTRKKNNEYHAELVAKLFAEIETLKKCGAKLTKKTMSEIDAKAQATESRRVTSSGPSDEYRESITKLKQTEAYQIQY